MELKQIIEEVKKINDGKHSTYENLVFVLFSTDKTEKRMANVTSYPCPLTK